MVLSEASRVPEKPHRSSSSSFGPYWCAELAPTSPKLVESGFCELLRLDGILGSTHGPGPMLIEPTGTHYKLSLSRLSGEAKGAAGSSTFRKQILTSRKMPCRQAEALNAWCEL